MGPEVLFLFVVLIVTVFGGGGLYAIRGGLRFKKADTDTRAQAGKAPQRPVHTVVENETADRLTKPGDTAPPGADDRPA